MLTCTGRAGWRNRVVASVCMAGAPNTLMSGFIRVAVHDNMFNTHLPRTASYLLSRSGVFTDGRQVHSTWFVSFAIVTDEKFRLVLKGVLHRVCT